MSSRLGNTTVTDDERALMSSPHSSASGRSHQTNRDLDVSEKIKKVNELQNFLRSEDDKIESEYDEEYGMTRGGYNDDQYYDGYYGHDEAVDDYGDGGPDQQTADPNGNNNTLKVQNENLLLEDFDSSHALQRSVENLSRNANPYEGEKDNKEQGLFSSCLNGIRNSLFGKKVDPIEVNDVNSRPVRKDAFEEHTKSPNCFKACF